MVRRGGYGKNSLPLWSLAILTQKKNKKRIWIQAVSVGELSSIHPLLESLINQSDIEIVLSGTTSTGLKIAQKKYSEQILKLGPFPLDWFPFSSLAWSKIQPDLAICVDSELWPEHMNQAKKEGFLSILTDDFQPLLQTTSINWFAKENSSYENPCLSFIRITKG